MKPDYLKIGKMAAGTGLAIMIAAGMGLAYSASAGIITLLSIRDTKRETIRVTISRMVSFVVALFLSACCFGVFGYGPLSISVFLVFFALFCTCFKMMEGFSANTVLITHFLRWQSMAFSCIANEILLLLIGAGLGVLLNLYIPGKEKGIRKTQRKVEEQMRRILAGMSEVLAGKAKIGWEGQMEEAFAFLERELERGEKTAFQEMENHFWADINYYFSYMNMRKTQRLVLLRMEKLLGHFQAVSVQAGQVAALMGKVCVSFHEYNNAVWLLGELDRAKVSMKKQPMPACWEEFEDKALLYQILQELEEFLLIKKKFADSLSEEEKRRFWGPVVI